MDDLISRKAAIDAECEVCQIAPKKERGHNCTYYVHGCKEIECLRALPFAQPERKRGEWILIKGSNGKDYHKCSECLHTQDITGVKNYCAVCGADMRGEQNEKIVYEEYRLVLTHTYVDGDGERTVLEDPVEVAYVFPVDRNKMFLPNSICINHMMDCMRNYLLQKVGE